MTTALDIELLQKTSEYALYVKEYMNNSGNDFFSNPDIQIGYEGDILILQYKGK